MPENENASRAWASFILIGKGLNSNEVTSLFGINPDRAFNQGDPRGADKVWPHGFWELSSQGLVASTDLERHIVWLLDHIEPLQSQLQSVRTNRIRAEISCFWESRTGHGGPSFSPGLLRRIAGLDLELGLDIYFES